MCVRVFVIVIVWCCAVSGRSRAARVCSPSPILRSPFSFDRPNLKCGSIVFVSVSGMAVGKGGGVKKRDDRVRGSTSVGVRVWAVRGERGRHEGVFKRSGRSEGETMQDMRWSCRPVSWSSCGRKCERKRDTRKACCEEQQSINGGDRTLDLKRVKLAS